MDVEVTVNEQYKKPVIKVGDMFNTRDGGNEWYILAEIEGKLCFVRMSGEGFYKSWDAPEVAKDFLYRKIREGYLTHYSKEDYHIRLETKDA